MYSEYTYPKYSWPRRGSFIDISKGGFFLTRFEETADESSIIITALRIHIEFKLSRSKAMATLEVDIDHNEGIHSYEYRILKLASGVMVCIIESSSDSIKKALESRGLLERPFYDLVARIGRDLVGSPNDMNETQKAIPFSQHTRFMSHLEDIHHNFESGYQHLIHLGTKLR